MRDFKVISFNSFSSKSLIDLKPRFANSGFAGASNVLLVVILTALLCILTALLLESAHVSCATTSPDRRAISKMWLYYASIQVFQDVLW